MRDQFSWSDGPRVDSHAAVAEAMAVVHRSLGQMANAETRPLLDAPSRPYRLRAVGDSGIGVYPVVLGTAAFGTVPEDQAFAALDAYRGAGGNAIETDTNSGERAQRIVGEWLRVRGRRGITLITRIGGGAGDLSASNIARSLDVALGRQRTDHIDLLVLAAEDPATPLEETLTAAGATMATDSVAAIAAGDVMPARLLAARVFSAQRGLPAFTAVLPRYNLADRVAFEDVMAPIAAVQELAVLPTAPLAGGFLAEQAPSRAAMRRLRESDPGRAERVAALATRRGLRTQGALAALASERGVPVATMALSWLLAKPRIVAPIVNVQTVEHVHAITAASGLHLTRAEVAALDHASED